MNSRLHTLPEMGVRALPVRCECPIPATGALFVGLEVGLQWFDNVLKGLTATAQGFGQSAPEITKCGR